MKKEITTDDLRRFETSFDSSRVNRVAMNAAAQAAAFDKEPIVLHPWDPMGSLAW